MPYVVYGHGNVRRTLFCVIMTISHVPCVVCYHDSLTRALCGVLP